MAMQFEKKNFMGIELDVLVGHPEHDLLFVATQVARAAGLKDASTSVTQARRLHSAGRALVTLTDKSSVSLPKDSQGRRMRSTSVLFSEPEVYAMLLRGNAPQSEPFRKWVTEEVLPSIRKTGKYNTEESTNPIAQSIMDELKCLRSDIAALRQELSAKTFNLEAPAVDKLEPSPYEGQLMVALCDPAGFSARTYRELAGETIPRPAVDKLESRVVLHLEIELGKKWREGGGAPLKEHVSKERRKWTLYPSTWLRENLTRKLYIDAIKAVVAEKLAA